MTKTKLADSMNNLYSLLKKAFGSSKNAQWKQFVVHSHDYLSNRQDKLIKEFNIGEYQRYDWDQENATLTFSDEQETKVIAKVQFVGALSSQTKTWLWSWANDTILQKAKSKMHKVKLYGEEHNFKPLIKSKWFGSEPDGWDMTSVSAFILKAKGAYRIPAENGFTYLVITDIKWA
ncbi:DUF6882 domain-containing protein [Marinomonas epiphytica]